jgi:hypothetical protein
MLLPKYNNAGAIMPREKGLYRQLKAFSITLPLAVDQRKQHRKGSTDEARTSLGVQHVCSGRWDEQR